MAGGAVLWSDDEFQALLYTLAGSGFPAIDPGAVRQKLEELVDEMGLARPQAPEVSTGIEHKEEEPEPPATGAQKKTGLLDGIVKLFRKAGD